MCGGLLCPNISHVHFFIFFMTNRMFNFANTKSHPFIVPLVLYLAAKPPGTQLLRHCWRHFRARWKRGNNLSEEHGTVCGFSLCRRVGCRYFLQFVPLSVEWYSSSKLCLVLALVWGSSVSCILRIMLNITVVCGVFVLNLYFSALVSNTIDVVVLFHKKMNSKRGVQASIAVYEPERITFFP